MFHKIKGKCRCGNEPRHGQRNCYDCHASYMRWYRKKNPLEGEAKKKKLARDYARTYIRRGRLIIGKCEQCPDGSEPNNIHAHHDNYDKPTDITWLCREHHLKLHGKEARKNIFEEKRLV